STRPRRWPCLPPWAVLVSDAAPERALRAELAELRAQVAERGRIVVLLQDDNAALRDHNAALQGHNAALQGQVAALAEQVAELTRRLGENSRNSHRPPGSEGYAKPAPKSRRTRGARRSGGQPGHEGRTLRQVEDPDEVIIHTPAHCPCGRSLRHAPVSSTERRQVVDLPEIHPRVVEHQLMNRACRCGRVVEPTAADGVPAGLGGPVQYGPGVRALAVYLLAAQHLPVARTAELLREVLGLPVSEGSLVTWYAAAADGLEGFTEAVKTGLTQAAVLGADETGARVEGRLAWIHSLRTDELTWYEVFTGAGARGTRAMRAIGVLPALGAQTVLVSDFWSPYWEFTLTHQVCAAHLGRELTAAADVAGQSDWATGLDTVLTEMIVAAHEARTRGAPAVTPARRKRLRARYTDLLALGWAANPDYEPVGKTRRKRPKHVNLLDRLDTHREEVWRFLDDTTIPATNNGSEQDIRMVKVRLKVCGGLRTLAGAQAFCRLRSYLSTARKQRQSALAVLRQLCAGVPWIPAIPLATS
ncbi:MAG: IS66 family transposase, partial [Mycobacteriales bacterium]